MALGHGEISRRDCRMHTDTFENAGTFYIAWSHGIESCLAVDRYLDKLA